MNQNHDPKTNLDSNHNTNEQIDSSPVKDQKATLDQNEKEITDAAKPTSVSENSTEKNHENIENPKNKETSSLSSSESSSVSSSSSDPSKGDSKSSEKETSQHHQDTSSTKKDENSEEKEKSKIDTLDKETKRQNNDNETVNATQPEKNNEEVPNHTKIDETKDTPTPDKLTEENSRDSKEETTVSTNNIDSESSQESTENSKPEKENSQTDKNLTENKDFKETAQDIPDYTEKHSNIESILFSDKTEDYSEKMIREYLKKTFIIDGLEAGIQEIVEKRPGKPVKEMGKFLVQYYLNNCESDNQNKEKIFSRFEEKLKDNEGEDVSEEIKNMQANAYLETYLVANLMQGLFEVMKEQKDIPLLWLGEYLLND